MLSFKKTMTPPSASRTPPLVQRGEEKTWSRLLPRQQPVDRLLGLVERRLGVLAAERGVLDLGPERVLQLGVIGQRPVPGELVGMRGLGSQHGGGERLGLL